MSTYQVACVHTPTGLTRTKTVQGKKAVFRVVAARLAKWASFRIKPKHIDVTVAKLGRDGMVVDTYSFNAGQLPAV